MHMRDASRVTRNSTTTGHDTIIQIMHINQRIRIKTPESESLANFYQKLILYFEIDQSLNKLGLLERVGKEKYEFASEKCELKPDHLYYLYFKEKPDQISPSQLQEEETKRSKSPYSNSPTTNSGSVSRRFNGIYSQFQGKCLKEFSETGNLKTHMRTHTGERPFVCQQCNQQFITKGHLQAHELTHTGEKPFICNFQGCNKRYSRAGRLKIHQRLHTGERPFICQMEGCEKAFREKGNLLTHMRIHNGQKPFRCDFADCDMNFTTQGHLTDHKRRHSGERPYICEICNDKFMRSSTLKIHMRRHTGEKPYKCDKCEKAFSESGNLKTHQKIHEDEFSPLGKRIKNNSRFSTPKSTLSTKKRTLKATRKHGQCDSNLHEIESFSPDGIKAMPMQQLQLDFKANQNQRRKASNQYSGHHNHQQQQHHMMRNQNQSPSKDDDIKIPLVKTEIMPNDTFGYYMNINEPTSMPHQYINQHQQQMPQSSQFMNPFSPSSILNQHQISQFSSPKFAQLMQSHPHLLNLNTPSEANTMRVSHQRGKFQNQQHLQQYQDIKKVHANPYHLQNQGNSTKFSPIGTQIQYMDSPDITQHHNMLISNQQAKNQQLINDISPLYRKPDGQIIKLGSILGNGHPNQVINTPQQHYTILQQQPQNMTGQASIQLIQAPNAMQLQHGQNGVKEEEAQSFSSLAKFWQNRGNSSQSPCVSQDASPLLRKPAMTPRQNDGGYNNFSNLSSSMKPTGQMFNPSENSAFKKGSPRVLIDQSRQTIIHNFSSPSNTPKIIAQEQLNRQMHLRKNSNFSTFHQPSNTPNMHIYQQQQQKSQSQLHHAQQHHLMRPPTLLTMNNSQQSAAAAFRGNQSPNFEDIQSPGLLQSSRQLGGSNLNLLSQQNNAQLQMIQQQQQQQSHAAQAVAQAQIQLQSHLQQVQQLQNHLNVQAAQSQQ